MTDIKMFYRFDSEARLSFYEGGLEFEDLLELYSMSDRPQAQEPGFSIWYEDFLEKAPLHEIREPIKLYRGTSFETVEHYKNPIMWTRDKNLAEWFANHCVSIRYQLFGGIDRTPLILEHTFNPNEIIYAHKNGRDEDEVFVKLESFGID